MKFLLENEEADARAVMFRQMQEHDNNPGDLLDALAKAGYRLFKPSYLDDKGPKGQDDA